VGAVVNCAAYAKGRRVCDVELSGIAAALQDPERFVWIGLHEPSEEILRQVQREFGLHDLAVEDAHRAHQRPKLERYDDSLFIVLRTAQMNPNARHIEFGETHLFVGPRYVVSVRHGPSLTYTDVRARCEHTPHLLSKGPGFVLYALMDFIVDHYFPIVEALEDQLETLEDEIFGAAVSRETTRRIYELKRQLLEFKRAVSPLVDVCSRLMRFDLELVPEDIRPYFRDVYDHVIRVNELVDGLQELLKGALEAHLSLTTVAENESMKRVAAWAAILAVPTMIAGVYGMNFEVMPELRWSFGYPLTIAAMLATCGVLYWNFKRSGWL
jgi:magnesium transporter